MKRIVTIILALTLVLGVCNFSALADYTPAEEFMIAINAAGKDNYSSDDMINRAEFAEIIAGICNLMDANSDYNAWLDNVYGTDNKDVIIPNEDERVFADVDESLPQYEAVMTVFRHGYMTGMTATHFGPTYDITMAQAIKVIVAMLGYESMAEVKGGYPDGYIKTASTIKLTSGMNVTPHEFVTNAQVAQLIYNALDIPVYEVGAIGEDYTEYVKSENTFLKECLGLERIEGVMTDNGISTIYGKSKGGEDTVTIGNVDILLEKFGYAREFLGRYVEAYYMPQNGRNHLVYAVVSEYDDAISVDIRDYASFKNGQLSYYDKNGKLKSETLSKANLIYNGVALDLWNPTLLDDILFGDVTIVSSKADGKYDTIIVNDYMVGIVTKKDSNTGVIYADDIYENMNDVKTLDISDRNSAIAVVKDSLGNDISFEDISSGDIVSVLKSAENEYLKVVVSRNKLTGFLVESYDISDKAVLTGSSGTYELEYYKNLKDVLPIDIGKAYTLCFDFMGNLVYFESGSLSSSMNTAVLLQTAQGSNGFNAENAVRIYTSKGKIEEITIADRVNINGVSYDSDDAVSIIAPYCTDAVLYETIDGKLKNMILPLDFGEEDTDNRGWYRVTPKVELLKDGMTDEEYTSYTSNYGYKYQGSTVNSFSSLFILNKAATTYFGIPSTNSALQGDRQFTTNVPTFTDNSYYLINNYSRDPFSMMPEVCIGVSSGAAGGDVDCYSAFLVTKVSSSVDQYGEPATFVQGYEFNRIGSTVTEKSYILNDDTKFIGPYYANGEKTSNAELDPNDPELYREPKPFNWEASGPCELQPGDIFRFVAEGDGTLKNIRLCYDHSTGNTFSCGIVNGTAIQGGTLAGYPVYIRDDCVKFCLNEDEIELYNNPSFALNEEKFITHRIQGGTVYAVETVPRGISVKKITVDDIITYENSGQTPYKTVLLAYYNNENYGTIIFR